MSVSVFSEAQAEVIYSIVEFATSEDAQRAKTDLADKAFMGRSVFIREVSQPCFGLYGTQLTLTQDREESARFGAAPIPGKIGMAMGESRNFLGAQGGLGASPSNRNLFVGNVSRSFCTGEYWAEES